MPLPCVPCVPSISPPSAFQKPGEDNVSNCRGLLCHSICVSIIQQGDQGETTPFQHLLGGLPVLSISPSWVPYFSSHTVRLALLRDSFFSTPSADVFGGTRCSDKVTHPEKAHTTEDIFLLFLPGAPSAIAVCSSFSFLPSQITPKHFCLIFLKDVE